MSGALEEKHRLLLSLDQLQDEFQGVNEGMILVLISLQQHIYFHAHGNLLLLFYCKYLAVTCAPLNESLFWFPTCKTRKFIVLLNEDSGI